MCGRFKKRDRRTSTKIQRAPLTDVGERAHASALLPHTHTHFGEQKSQEQVKIQTRTRIRLYANMAAGFVIKHRSRLN